MRHLLYVLTVISLTSCSNSSDKNDSKIPNEQTELISGERIDGPANLRDTVNGKIIFTLNDNVLVETTPAENKWLVAGVFVMLTPKQIKDFKILPGTDLISTDKKVIGKTVDTVGIWMAEDSSGLIGAYTYIDNIKSTTIPEIILSKLINQDKTKLSDLEQFMTWLKFEKYELGKLPNLTQYFIYESIVVDMSPRDRITLLFSKDNTLVGIIHSRPLNTKKFQTYELIREHKLTITGDLSHEEIKKLIDKRIEFYNSVD